MSNPYEDYYVNQAGNGITSYQGTRYQRGGGFFGTLYNSVLKPIGKYLGRNFLKTSVGIGQDILQGENFKESARKRLKTTGKEMLNDAISKAQAFAQKGSGRKRKRKKPNKSRNTTKKSKKPKKKKTTRKSKKKLVKKKLAKSKHLSHLFA